RLLFLFSCYADHPHLHPFPNDALPISAALLITRITVVLLALAVAAWAVRTAHRNANPPPAPAPEVVATPEEAPPPVEQPAAPTEDRKSTRLNSSHVKISYAVFCLKKKK